ncbi:MAG TPA: hypothetical protein VIH57_01020 [Bacteroidales bacterium]
MQNLKLNAGIRSLNKKLRNFKRIRESHNLETAKTAGILFTPTDQTSFEQIKQFLTYLGNYKLQIYVLGYIDAKTIPESFLFWKGINLFSRKELGWSLVPKTAVVTDFIDKPFDILLDLSLDDFFPVEYIARLSKSKFKVGRFTENHRAYDLMFDIAKNKDLNSYLDYIKEYLNLINKEN